MQKHSIKQRFCFWITQLFSYRFAPAVRHFRSCVPNWGKVMKTPGFKKNQQPKLDCQINNKTTTNCLCCGALSGLLALLKKSKKINKKKAPSVVEFLSVSLQVSEPQDESTARRCYCPSDTARSVKVNPLRWLGGSPLTVLKTPRVGTKITSGTSTSCSQLFTVRASLGSSAPLLSPLLSWRTQVSSSSHSTFHFSLPLPPPQPLGMCRLYDSREIQRGGGGVWLQASPPTLRVPDGLCDLSRLRIVS